MDITPLRDDVKPWTQLPNVTAADLGEWNVRVGDIAMVQLHNGIDTDKYAKATEMKRYDERRYIVVYTWLYTREEVGSELQIGGVMPDSFQKYLDRKWPGSACHKYMFSTNRTLSIWDTVICRAPKEVRAKICDDAIYQTTQTERKILSKKYHGMNWTRYC